MFISGLLVWAMGALIAAMGGAALLTLALNARRRLNAIPLPGKTVRTIRKLNTGSWRMLLLATAATLVCVAIAEWSQPHRKGFYSFLERSIEVGLLCALVCSPYLGIGVAIWLLPRRLWAAITLCATAALVGPPAALVYLVLVPTANFGPGSWGTLIFLLIPAAQWIATLPLLLVAAVMARRSPGSATRKWRPSVSSVARSEDRATTCHMK